MDRAHAGIRHNYADYSVGITSVVERLAGGYAAVIGITLMVMRLFGNFVAVKRRLRRG